MISRPKERTELGVTRKLNRPPCRIRYISRSVVQSQVSEHFCRFGEFFCFMRTPSTPSTLRVMVGGEKEKLKIIHFRVEGVRTRWCRAVPGKCDEKSPSSSKSRLSRACGLMKAVSLARSVTKINAPQVLFCSSTNMFWWSTLSTFGDSRFYRQNMGNNAGAGSKVLKS